MLIGLRNIRLDLPKYIIKNSSNKRHLIRLTILLILILMSHTLAMMLLEDMSLMDAIWLTMTSATTVGYGDLSAQTTNGRLATIVLLYIAGIATLAQVVTMYFEFRQEIRNRILIGNCSWNMKNHLVFLHSSKDISEEYFYQAVIGLRKSGAELSNASIIIVSEEFTHGISDRLRRLNVLHVNKPITDTRSLQSASIHDANTIIILSKNRTDPTSDSINFELIYRLREIGVKGRIVAEAVKDENRIRFKKMGADNVLRPIRSYPELLMRTVLAPGSEQIMETLFNSLGEECIKYKVNANCTWLNIVEKLSSNDLGTPISYENLKGEVVNNPSSKETIVAKAIFVIVNEGETKSNQYIENILKNNS